MDNKIELLKEQAYELDEKINFVCNILFTVSDAVQLCCDEGKETKHILPLIKIIQDELNSLIEMIKKHKIEMNKLID